MFYEYRLAVPASTPSDAPVTQVAELDAGVVTFVEVQFPSGCVGLVHTYARRGIHQLWPTNPDGDFAADGARLQFTEAREVLGPPYEIELAAWSDDDTFQHTITWRIGVIPMDLFRRQRDAGDALAYLATWWRSQGAPP